MNLFKKILKVKVTDSMEAKLQMKEVLDECYNDVMDVRSTDEEKGERVERYREAYEVYQKMNEEEKKRTAEVIKKVVEIIGITIGVELLREVIASIIEYETKGVWTTKALPIVTNLVSKILGKMLGGC